MIKKQKEIPVIVGFHRIQRIGTLYLDDDVKIPLNCVFALGGLIKKVHKEGDVKVIDEFELSSISLTTDNTYDSYLHSPGREENKSFELQVVEKKLWQKVKNFNLSPLELGKVDE